MLQTPTAADPRGLTVFSERGYLSGVSARLRAVGCPQGAVSLELHEMHAEAMHPLRTARFDTRTLEADGIDHLYWEPIEASEGRFFVVRVMPSPNDVPQSVS